MLLTNYPRLCTFLQKTSQHLHKRLNSIQITHRLDTALQTSPAYQFMLPVILLITVIMSSSSSLHQHTFISLHYHSSILQLMLDLNTSSQEPAILNTLHGHNTSISAFNRRTQHHSFVLSRHSHCITPSSPIISPLQYLTEFASTPRILSL